MQGCFVIDPKSYRDEVARPPELLSYYDDGRQILRVSDRIVDTLYKVTKSEIEISTPRGKTHVIYFDGPSQKPELLLVFPLMGGSQIVSEHFAHFFARYGYDAAIVKRNNDFKDPENFPKLESLLRDTVVRDRVTLDYFEKYRGKTSFGSFGISRGAINALMTAGVDKRLKYNVLVMGAADIPSIFKYSTLHSVKKYQRRVMKKYNLTEEEFISTLQDKLKTNPSTVTKYLLPQDTMLILAALDSSVPIQDGLKMRKELGYPRTIFIPANHYIGAILTQIISIKEPFMGRPVFPFDYIEGEAMSFYREKFRGDFREKRPLVAFLKAPLTLLASFISQLSAPDPT